MEIKNKRKTISEFQRNTERSQEFQRRNKLERNTREFGEKNTQGGVPIIETKGAPFGELQVRTKIERDRDE